MFATNRSSVSCPGLSWILRITVSALLAFVFCGGAAAQEKLATAQEPEVWVTMGRDFFDHLASTPGILSGLLPPRAIESEGDVVLTRLLQRDLLAVSVMGHEAFRRCSGYIVHTSYAEAAAALAGANSPVARTAPSEAFEIDKQTTVQALLPLLDKTNILDTIDVLSNNYTNRYYQYTSGQQSALWIRDLWQGYAAGRSDITVTTYDHSGWAQPSVVMTIAGTSLASEIVVIGGHLDSIKSGGMTTATVAPGADDNASGIATISEVVRVLLADGFTPDRTMKFFGYAAEEVGLQGSSEIAADHLAGGDDVVAVLQLDMTDYQGSAEDIALIDDFTNTELSAFVGSLIDTYQPSLLWTYSTCGYACSDHASWHNRGYPAVMPFEARLGQHNPQIHSSNDTLATLGNSTDHALKFAKLALSFAVETGLAGCTPAAVGDAGPDRTINEGSSTAIGTPALPGHGYSWAPGGATTAQINVSPSATTTYTVTATTNCGSVQDSITVTVVPAGQNGPQIASYDPALGAPKCAVAGSSCDSSALLDGRGTVGPEPNQPNTIDTCTDGSSGSYHTDESNDRIVVSSLDGLDMAEGNTVQIDVTVWAWSAGADDSLDLYTAADANNPSWSYLTTLQPAAGSAQTLSAQYTLPAGSLQAVRANFRYQGSNSSCPSGNYDDTDDLVFAVGSGGPECTLDSECDDGLFCNGAETCFGGSCQAGGDPCPGQSCNETTNSCEGGQPVIATFLSIAAEDGWVRESSETSGVGGAVSSTGTGKRPLRPGDTTQDRQYKAIVSFDTSSIPTGATIQSATLRLRRGSVRGSNPFTSGFGQCLVDVQSGGFSGSTALQTSDFQAAASATAAAALSAPPANEDWSEGLLDAAGLAAIDPSGTTQLRIYFEVDDNDDGGDDQMGYYSGDHSSSANHPQLVVTYLP